MRLSIAVLMALGLTLWTRPVRACACEKEWEVRKLEQYARDGKVRPALDPGCMQDAQAVPRYSQRTLVACRKVLASDPGYAPCVEWSVKFGAKTLGAIDLFERVGALFALEPFSMKSQALPLYEALGDPRAAAVVRRAYLAAEAAPRANRTRRARAYLAWRQGAVRLLGKLGGPPERQFLAAQLDSVEDEGLARAIEAALAALDQDAPLTP